MELSTSDVSDILRCADESDNFIVLPKHIRCMAHTFNLICVTDFNNGLEGFAEFHSLFKAVLKKCSTLWNGQNQSNIKADIIKRELGKLLKTPGATRWNSLYDSISDLNEHLCNNFNKLESACQLIRIAMFTSNEKPLIKNICMAFQPIAIALDKIQAETSCGIAIPIIKKVISHLSTASDDEFLQTMKQILKQATERRFRNVLNYQFFQCAAAMHPLFKIKFIQKYYHSHVNTKQKLKTEYNQICEEIQIETPPPNSQTSSFSFWESDDEDVYQTPNTHPLEIYWNDPEKNIEILKKNDFKAAKILFLKYNSALSSSAPVERLFSISKHVLCPERSSMTDEHFQQQLLLKIYSLFFDFLILLVFIFYINLSCMLKN